MNNALRRVSEAFNQLLPAQPVQPRDALPGTLPDATSAIDPDQLDPADVGLPPDTSEEPIIPDAVTMTIEDVAGATTEQLFHYIKIQDRLKKEAEQARADTAELQQQRDNQRREHELRGRAQRAQAAQQLQYEDMRNQRRNRLTSPDPFLDTTRRPRGFPFQSEEPLPDPDSNRKSPKYPDPEPYDGNREGLEGFIFKLKTCRARRLFEGKLGTIFAESQRL